MKLKIAIKTPQFLTRKLKKKYKESKVKKKALQFEESISLVLRYYLQDSNKEFLLYLFLNKY